MLNQHTELLAGYLDQKCAFKELSTAGHERLGQYFLWEIETQEIQTRIQVLESYDDAPEKDAMTIFE